jgi:hypothetical protein
MKIVADGVAILIDDDESQFRAPWIVRLEGSKVLMELRYDGQPYESELGAVVTENGIYAEYADFMLAQIMDAM